MRTTVRLDDSLLAAAKTHAVETGRTLTQVIADALRTFLARDRQRRSPDHRPEKLPTFDGGGLQPGVDLDNTADLLDIMEGLDAAR